MKINQIKIGAFLSYMQMFLGVVIGLLYTPIMLRLLGQNEYGLYHTATSTISMLSILNLGFNSGYIRYYSKYKQENDLESIWRLNGLFLIIFSVIGLIALVCGTFLVIRLDLVFDNGLTALEYQIAKILMLLLTVNISISFPMCVFSNIIASNEKYVFLKLMGIIKTVISPLITLLFLLKGFGSIAMVMVTMIVSLIVDLLYVYYVLRVLNNKFKFHDLDKKLFFSLFGYTSLIAINLIVDQINWNIDKVLLARFKGTASVAVYSVGFSLYHYYMNFSTSISSIFTPRIHRIINENSKDLDKQRRVITELFVKVGRLQFIILTLISTGLLFFGKQFITQYYAGADYIDSYYITLLLVFSASIALTQNLGIEIQRALNKHKVRTVVYFVMALCNLGMSIVLIRKYGAIGSAIGTAVSLVIANGCFINIYYNKKCNIDIIAFWKNILLLCRGLLVPCAIGIIILKYVTYTSIWSFLLAILGYTLVYLASMWFFGINEYEKELIKKPLRKFVRR